MTIKKALFLVLAINIFCSISCQKKEGGEGGGYHAGSYITNVHAPTSGTDSITFTADSSMLSLTLFSPLGGSNMVIVRNLSNGTILFQDTVSSIDKRVTNFTPGSNYSIMCYSGSGTPAFGNVASSFRNSGQTPSPFTGYTQYYNHSNSQGPSDGVAVIVMEQPTNGSKIEK